MRHDGAGEGKQQCVARRRRDLQNIAGAVIGHGDDGSEQKPVTRFRAQADEIEAVKLLLLRRRQIFPRDVQLYMGQFLRRVAVGHALDLDDEQIILERARRGQIVIAAGGIVEGVIGDGHRVLRIGFKPDFAAHAVRRAKNPDQHIFDHHPLPAKAPPLCAVPEKLQTFRIGTASNKI